MGTLSMRIRSRPPDGRALDQEDDYAELPAGQPDTWTGFENLVRSRHEGLRRFAHRLLRAPDQADDALQDAYLKAWRSLGAFRESGDDSQTRWLYRIVYHSCLDELRRVRRRRVPSGEQAGDLIDPAPGPEAAVVARTSLAAALEQLSDEARAAVLLVDGQGFDYAAAAAILDVPRGTIASRLSVARSVLRKVLTESDDLVGSGDNG